MAVIALPNVSPQGPSPVMEWGSKTFNEEFESPFTGQNQTYGNGANVARQSARLTFENLSESRRAVLKRFLGQCRGRANRFYVPDYSHTIRGSFPATELLTNNTFASGTTGWTSESQYTLSAADSVLMATRIATGTAQYFAVKSSVSITQYAPHAARFLVLQGRGSYSSGFRIDTTDTVGPGFTAYGLRSISEVVRQPTTTTVAIRDGTTSGLIAGDSVMLGYASYARCMLVDNGPNLLLHSDDFSNAAWTKGNATVSANAINAPDGSATGDNVVENSSNTTHIADQFATVPSTADDFVFTVALVQNGRTWAALDLVENSGPSSARAWFNLATGAVGTVAASGGWSNPRASIRPLGATGGWYQVTLVARKTNSATSVGGRVYLSTGDGVLTYTGDGSSAIGVWRGTLAASGVPVKLSQTAATATAGTSQTGGALRLKGLPVSTSGLLLADDLVEIVTPTASEMKRVTAPLNSDAVGLGYLQFEPPLRKSPADGAAVIVCRPMMRALLDSNSVRWTERLGGFADLEFTCVEDMV